ncbi:MAG: Bax inhibitor-1/YccA family protein [Actinomycetota bacterium]|nr:MAG: Bax inhibitor-1/YccA family protein [Actinomycetota bacterium]
METRNPILSRMAKPEQGGAGFAYDEGRSAYTQAATGTATAATPAPSADDLRRMYTAGTPTGVGARVTLNDVIVKTGICFVLVVIGAVVGWNTADSMPLIWFGAAMIGLVLGLVNAFKRQVSPALVLLYALVQGVFLGGISYAYNDWVIRYANYQGLVMQAVIGTLTAFGVMLLVYNTGLIKVDGKFAKVMVVAIISYAVIGLMSLVAAIFGVGGGFGFYGMGWLGVALCAVGVLLASFTLLLDFEAIKQGIAMGLPERESWRMSFGLLVTLIWLYLEILRMLAMIAAASR